MTDDKKWLLCLLDDVLSTYRFDAWENSDKIADHLVQHGVTFAKDKDALNKLTPVSKQLPEPEQDVLMLFASGIVTGGFYVHESETWCAYSDGEYYTDCSIAPTHWMSMPEELRRNRYGSHAY